MSAGPRVAVAGALASVERRLLGSVAGEWGGVRAAAPPRPVVAVVGLATGCGATTVARALAGGLGARDPAGAAAVTSAALPRRGALVRSASSARLARMLSRAAPIGARAAGRLCLVETEHLLALTAAAMDVAPLVLDVTAGGDVAEATALADQVVLVVSSSCEPALAEVVATSLASSGPEPLCAVNRVRDTARWHDRAAVLLPDTRLGARLAGAGHSTRGAFGPGLRELVDRCAVFA